MIRFISYTELTVAGTKTDDTKTLARLTPRGSYFPMQYSKILVILLLFQEKINTSWFVSFKISQIANFEFNYIWDIQIMSLMYGSKRKFFLLCKIQIQESHHTSASQTCHENCSSRSIINLPLF